LHSLQDPPTAIQLSHRRAELQQRVRYSLSLAQVPLEAATYFLPVDSAIGILASTPPTDQPVDAIRLPFPAVSIYFGADLAIDQRFIFTRPSAASLGTTSVLLREVEGRGAVM